MIISRTPFRISFFGGGGDYPAFYEEHGGAVLSTAINKYCYINLRYLPPFFKHKYRIRYTEREEVNDINEIKHPSVRECMKFLQWNDGVEIVHSSDLPSMSGIGSSSSFTVGLLNSLYAMRGKIVTKRQLALDAIHVEQDLIKENVGSQDQTAASFGGLNKIEFGGKEKISVLPITITQEKSQELQEHLMLFFVGFPRQASVIASEQIKNIPMCTKDLLEMKDMVDEAVDILCSGKLEDFGDLLHCSWWIKRRLSKYVTNSVIDDIYKKAIDAGAIGGKLLGAGGGGFMLFFVRPELHDRVKIALSELLYVPFRFQDTGSQIIYFAREEND
jgi:D-glycero-alpha-D-manno-heptose-7-phosphate kinase